jgi:lysozyme
MAKVSGKAAGAGAVVVLGSAAIMSFLGVWEPAKRDPGLVYADKLADGLPTVCKGITRHVTKTPVIVGERWSPGKCAAEERAAVVMVQRQLLGCFHREPPQSVFDAATSHAWNFGYSRTCMSSAMQAWNAGNWALGCQRIQKSDSGRLIWSVVRKPDGSYQFVQGLANRRAAEREMCMRDVR